MEQKDRNIPLMIIEPVKTEYRGLKAFKKHTDTCIRSLSNRLVIYTPGNERLSPIRINPLEVMAIGLDEHIQGLMSCFMAVMPVSGPLPALLLEALERVYEIYPDPDYPPVMIDLIDAAIEVLNSKDYSPETKSDIRTALEVRIGMLTRSSIGRVFQCRYSVPSIEHLVNVPSIIEMNSLSAEQARFLTLVILNRVRQIRKVSAVSADRLIFYVIILEEAHVIIGRSSDARPAEDNPNTRAHTTEFVCRMLAELRAYDIPVIIVDQTPSAIATEVIKLTGTKLALRQVANEDRQVLGGTMLLNNAELEDMARLQLGEGFLFTQGYFRARRIRTINLRKKLDLNTELHDDELRAIIQQEQWFQQDAIKRICTELDQLKEGMDRYDSQKIDLTGKVTNLLKVYEYLLGQEEGRYKEERLDVMIRSLRMLRQRLISSYNKFKTGPYRMFSYLIAGEINIQDNQLKALAKSLSRRFETVIKSGTLNILAVIDRLTKSCMKLKFEEVNHAKKKRYTNTRGSKRKSGSR